MMNTKSLDLFLKALELTFKGKRGTYVLKTNTYDCRFPAYKKLLVEVWYVDGSYKTLISTAEIVGKYDTTAEKEYMEDSVMQSTILNILKFYGL